MMSQLAVKEGSKRKKERKKEIDGKKNKGEKWRCCRGMIARIATIKTTKLFKLGMPLLCLLEHDASLSYFPFLFFPSAQFVLVRPVCWTV